MTPSHSHVHAPLRTLEALVLVGVGGFAGANLRYGAALVAPGLPSTLAVNALGNLVGAGAAIGLAWLLLA